MKSLILKTKINLFSVIICFVMVILHLILQVIKGSVIQLNSIFFTISGFIFIVYILYRELTKRNKYTVFISYIILIVLLIFIILMFNQLATGTMISTVFFILSSVFGGIALGISIIALFHDLEWYKKQVMLYAHIIAASAVILTTINLLLNYTWDNNIGNFIIITICTAMFNVMIEALIRSLNIKPLAFFADNYLLTGIVSLILIFWMMGGI